MNITLLSAYHSGSHKSWAEGYAKHSRHAVHLLTMPGRFWKWRMHGGALSLAQQFSDHVEPPDLLLVDDMLDLTTFLSMTRRSSHSLPVALYMHENQLTYPLPSDPTTGAMRRNHNERDHHYVFINYSTMLAADHIYFNSRYHLESWFEALPRYLRHYPDHRSIQNVDLLRDRSSVLPVGIPPRAAPVPSLSLNKGSTTAAPLILWNQRWEYDKNPDAFFAALYVMKERGIPFQLAVCGENFSRKPSVFDEAKQRLSAEIVHFGFAERPQYQTLLSQADIVISTAEHEFFGISILEAILYGAFPLLPNRLSYPELIPKQHHHQVLYADQTVLVERLATVLANLDSVREVADSVRISAEKFIWPTLAVQYDTLFAGLVA